MIMKIRTKHLLAISALCFSIATKAQDSCYIQLMVAPMEHEQTVPQSVANLLEIKLINAVTSVDDMTASKDYAHFFLSGRFDNRSTEVMGTKVVVQTTLTLYIGDFDRKSILSSQSFELRGIGNTEEKALLHSLNQIRVNNRQIKLFLEQGKEKIIDYYDKNYMQYLDSALLADKKGKVEEALYYSTLIPTKSKGYAEAKQTTDKIMKKCNTKKSATTIGKDWNKQQKRPIPTINFVKYK